MLVASKLRIILKSRAYGNLGMFSDVWAYCEQDEEQFLDVIHATLDVLRASIVVQRPPAYEELEWHLVAGQSAWRATEKGLVRRADPTAVKALTRVTAHCGSASDEDSSERSSGEQRPLPGRSSAIPSERGTTITSSASNGKWRHTPPPCAARRSACRPRLRGQRHSQLEALLHGFMVM
jgi:hypothetical protein